ncbi:MAG TPA: Type 1 glutamine amidotransferase-like domain-containing protein [Dehalococcoidia bacterium]|nr:Type 1 glutamine amidotransferase-like domain-containing protein [Dehalococcoidia bacterium]
MSALGPVILAGGAEFDERMAAADRAWLAARSIGVPRVGVFPTANDERPDRAAANGAAHFRRLATHAEPVMVTTRATTAEERVLNQISKLDFAYFAGGNPLHLAATLAGSPAWQALAGRWRAGMGLGGSSAGAMVLGERIFLRGDWADALRLLPGCVILPHFNRWEAHAVERAREALAAEGLVGLGIDESTALVWSPASGWAVAGPGMVTVLDGAGLRRYSSGQSPLGPPEPAA